MAATKDIQNAVEKTVLQTAKIMEGELDAEIERLENMDSEELDKLRCGEGGGLSIHNQSLFIS